MKAELEAGQAAAVTSLVVLNIPHAVTVLIVGILIRVPTTTAVRSLLTFTSHHHGAFFRFSERAMQRKFNVKLFVLLSHFFCY